MVVELVVMGGCDPRHQRNDLKRFYDALRTIYGPQSPSSTPILDAGGTKLITGKTQILERWAEHFQNVLNNPSNISDEAISRIPKVPLNNKLDTPPSLDEVKKAISQLSSGKAPGQDSISIEISKAGGQITTQKMTDLFRSIWEREVVPQELKDATIVHLYKRKGYRQSCDNHRGISLLSIVGKILTRVLLNRLIIHLKEDLLPEVNVALCRPRNS